MSNLFKMVKEANQLRQMQKQLEKQTVEYVSSDGKIKVVARGDMLVESISIDPSAMDPAKPERLTIALVSAINRAMEQAKKKSAAEMQKMMGGLGGLASLMGGK